MHLLERLIVAVLCVWIAEAAPFYGQPEQIHLSYGGNESRMFVTWTTFSSTLASVVEYGADGHLSLNASGRQTSFHKIGRPGKIYYMHKVLLTELTPGRTYLYHVGSPDGGWSPVYFFKALQEPENGFTYAVYGDLGNVNGRSIPRLQQAAQRGEFDVVLHVGDFAYNLDTANGIYGDQFMRQIEPIAAYLPYMTIPGNHENAQNFTHYVNRFTMPGGASNHFYSFDLGPVHFVGFSTEFYFYTYYGWKQIANQYNWLVEDLKKANANRDNVPWIITMGHRPMYCSTFDGDDCKRYESLIRVGFPTTHAYGLEELFYKNGVDLELWGHEHTYERFFPVYNRTIYNITSNPYLDPPAPVHVITGSAGCQEHTDHFMPFPPPWSAVRSSDYGYSIMKVYNRTHLYFEQKSDVKDGKVVDSFLLQKHYHGPYQHLKPEKRFKGHYVPQDYRHPDDKKNYHKHDL